MRAALGTPMNLAAALGYYRATWGTSSVDDPALAGEQAATSQLPPQPLLYLHGSADGCVRVEGALAWPGTVVVEGAGHFLHLERPAEVNRFVTDFLSPV